MGKLNKMGGDKKKQKGQNLTKNFSNRSPQAYLPIL
jgi:hypothetical protein